MTPPPQSPLTPDGAVISAQIDRLGKMIGGLTADVESIRYHRRPPGFWTIAWAVAVGMILSVFLTAAIWILVSIVFFGSLAAAGAAAGAAGQPRPTPSRGR